MVIEIVNVQAHSMRANAALSFLFSFHTAVVKREKETAISIRSTMSFN